MTPDREEVLRMAREAGFRTGRFDMADGHGTLDFVEQIGHQSCLVEVERLVAIAYEAGARAEREECAKRCCTSEFYGGANGYECAKAIRSRTT